MVTIDDVARHAGVAPSTVSYVLSGKRSISQTTRMRVEHSVRIPGDPVPEATLLEGRLTVRDSSGPAPSRAAPTP